MFVVVRTLPALRNKTSIGGCKMLRLDKEDERTWINQILTYSLRFIHDGISHTYNETNGAIYLSRSDGPAPRLD